MVGLWVRTVAKGTNTVVLLSIGSFSSGEKMDPEETGTNICTLSDQIEEEGVPCAILGLVPLLAEESRGAPYSSCWTSQVNHHLAQKCWDDSHPFLPLDHHMFRTTERGVLGAAPRRSLITLGGELGVSAQTAIGNEIVRYLDFAHKHT